MRFKLFVLFTFLAFISFKSKAQNCNLSLSGRVTDESSGKALFLANVIIKENGRAAITDSSGVFKFNNLCKNQGYHITFSHVSCQPKTKFITLKKDTILNVSFQHYITTVDEVVYLTEKDNPTTSKKITIEKTEITENQEKNFGQILEDKTGVSLLKNGNRITKPIVNGLYGNRVLIYDHGSPLSGQQWGNDHAPEIDPLLGQEIEIIKGTSSIEYMKGNLGSVVALKSDRVEEEPHLHGRAGYYYETNGRTHGLNFQIQKHQKWAAWRISGSAKKGGDLKTPDYFLRNTGFEELNFSLQVDKKISDKLFSQFFITTFNTELGILRGSHIGNLTDLERALTRDEPFFTEQDFTYRIDAPRQKVGHHTFKAKLNYEINSNQDLELLIGLQLNDRKEFDVRRGGRTNIPSLSLEQLTQNFELKHDLFLNNGLRIKSGLQYMFVDNDNVPGTGILPLLPDYTSTRVGAFTTLSKTFNSFFVEAGLRYDFENQDVNVISRDIPRRILDFNNNFNNFNFSAGAKYTIDDKSTLSYNIGLGNRNPAINELYSFGLHQGVSGIEEGSFDLNEERSIKTTLNWDFVPSDKFLFEALVYYQNFKDYIYLQPQNEFRLTIRGAFPVFIYQQTDAQIMGLDLWTKYEFIRNTHLDLKLSLIDGKDLTNDRVLVFIPSHNVKLGLEHELAKSFKLGKINLENIHLKIFNEYEFQKNGIGSDQDFAPAPEGYYLLGSEIGGRLKFKALQIDLSVKAKNILNTSYRNYLNRQRYFADEVGRSFVFGVNATF